MSKEYFSNIYQTGRSVNMVNVLMTGLRKSMEGRVGLFQTRDPFWGIVMTSLPKELKLRIIDVANEYKAERQKEFDEL